MNRSRDVKEFLARGGKIKRLRDAITRSYYENLEICGILEKERKKHGVERERVFFGGSPITNDERSENE